MNKMICIGVIFTFFVSCAPTKTIYIPVKQIKTVVDTVVERRIDSSMITALIRCDSNRQATIEYYESKLHNGSNTELSLKENKLRVETKWKTNVIDRVVTMIDTVTIVERVEVEVVKYKVPKLYKYCLYIVIGFLGFGAIKLFARFKFF